MIWKWLRIWTFVLGTLIAAMVAAYAFVTGDWLWRHIAIFAVSAIVIKTGVTLWYHRYLSHGAYQFTWCGYYTLRPVLAFSSAIGLQGPFAWWAKKHRQHHQAPADKPGDPHTPHGWGDGWRNRMYGFLYAHFLWLLHDDDNDTTEILSEPRMGTLERLYSDGFAYLMLGPVPWALLVGIWGGWMGIVWYLAAVCLTIHVTWGVNSVGHLWGWRSFETPDHSKNVILLCPLSEEYLHNCHHAFPKSARFAHAWWQLPLDPAYGILKLGTLLGLVHNLLLPSKEQIHSKRAA